MGGKFRKRLSRLPDARHNTQFEELDSLLRAVGFQLRESGGGSSHCTYWFEHELLLEPIYVRVVKARPVKAVYVMRVYQAITEVLEILAEQ